MKFKKIYKKQAFVIIKSYSGGKIEFVEGHFEEANARLAAQKIIKLNSANEFISIHTIDFIGEFVVEE